MYKTFFLIIVPFTSKTKRYFLNHCAENILTGVAPPNSSRSCPQSITSVTVLNKRMVNKSETSIMCFLFQLGGQPSWFIFFSCIRLKHAYCKGGKRVMRLTTQLPFSMSFLRLLHFNICIKEFYTHLNLQATKTLVLTAFIVFWVLFSSSVSLSCMSIHSYDIAYMLGSISFMLGA